MACPRVLLVEACFTHAWCCSRASSISVSIGCLLSTFFRDISRNIGTDKGTINSVYSHEGIRGTERGDCKDP